MTSIARPSWMLGACILAACFGTQPALERYRLAPADRSPPGFPEPASEVTVVGVEPYATPGIYGDPQIVYRIGETQYGAYPSREWALPLSEMLARLTAELLRSTGAVRVLDAPAAGAQGSIWRGAVLEFEEVNRGDSVSVSVYLEGTLVRAADDSVLWQGAARVERPVSADTMPAVVQALSEAAAAAVDSLITGAGLRGTSAAR